VQGLANGIHTQRFSKGKFFGAKLKQSLPWTFKEKSSANRAI
jgi:hypothetical protein